MKTAGEPHPAALHPPAPAAPPPRRRLHRSCWILCNSQVIFTSIQKKIFRLLVTKLWLLEVKREPLRAQREGLGTESPARSLSERQDALHRGGEGGRRASPCALLILSHTHEMVFHPSGSLAAVLQFCSIFVGNTQINPNVFHFFCWFSRIECRKRKINPKLSNRITRAKSAQPPLGIRATDPTLFLFIKEHAGYLPRPLSEAPWENALSASCCYYCLLSYERLMVLFVSDVKGSPEASQIRTAWHQQGLWRVQLLLQVCVCWASVWGQQILNIPPTESPADRKQCFILKAHLDYQDLLNTNTRDVSSQQLCVAFIPDTRLSQHAASLKGKGAFMISSEHVSADPVYSHWLSHLEAAALTCCWLGDVLLERVKQPQRSVKFNASLLLPRPNRSRPLPCHELFFFFFHGPRRTEISPKCDWFEAAAKHTALKPRSLWNSTVEKPSVHCDMMYLLFITLLVTPQLQNQSCKPEEGFSGSKAKMASNYRFPAAFYTNLLLDKPLLLHMKL